MSLAQHTVVYGGSFNPPHLGHQMACLYLLEGLGADQVWLVPAYRHAFGKELAPFADRLTMCRLMARPFGSRVSVSDVEQQVPSGRTFDTLTHLIARHPDQRFAMAVGADILEETDRWYRWDDIKALVPVVVVGRTGHGGGSEGALALPAVSSSDIRARLHRGEPILGLVPTSVAEYIATRRLYM